MTTTIENLMIIQALGTAIARKNQKVNRRLRKLELARLYWQMETYSRIKF